MGTFFYPPLAIFTNHFRIICTFRKSLLIKTIDFCFVWVNLAIQTNTKYDANRTNGNQPRDVV